jgi:hypothetical protein
MNFLPLRIWSEEPRTDLGMDQNPGTMIFSRLKWVSWVTHPPRVEASEVSMLEETDLYDDEILVKGRRWGGLSEFQDPRVGGLGNV